MKVYTKEKKQAKHSLAWVLMETDSILIKGAFQTSDRVSKKGLLDGNLLVEEYIDKRSYFVIV